MRQSDYALLHLAWHYGLRHLQCHCATYGCPREARSQTSRLAQAPAPKPSLCNPRNSDSSGRAGRYMTMTRHAGLHAWHLVGTLSYRDLMLEYGKVRIGQNPSAVFMHYPSRLRCIHWRPGQMSLLYRSGWGLPISRTRWCIGTILQSAAIPGHGSRLPVIA
jgi:hypothetical protein